MQEETIDYEECVGTASGAVFCSEHNLGSCLVPRTYELPTSKHVLHRPWPNHMVFLPYLNVLLWIMLAAPIAFFFYSRIKIPVMYRTNMYVSPAAASCRAICPGSFARLLPGSTHAALQLGITGSPCYPLLCLNGNRYA